MSDMTKAEETVQGGEDDGVDNSDASTPTVKKPYGLLIRGLYVTCGVSTGDATKMLSAEQARAWFSRLTVDHRPVITCVDCAKSGMFCRPHYVRLCQWKGRFIKVVEPGKAILVFGDGEAEPVVDVFTGLEFTRPS
jgi:hypothetical protein